MVVSRSCSGPLAFAGLGLLLAGTLRAEATLAVANGLFLLFLLLGGIVVPLDHLPAPLETSRRACRRRPLSDLLRVALGCEPRSDDLPGRSLVLLAAWGVGAVALAARTFRWE